MIRYYYRVEMKLCSPLSLSGGAGVLTDKDVLLNSKGEPYIPGSAIAGMLRAKFNEKDAAEFFGTISGKAEQSKIFTYDAQIDGAYKKSVRDSVKLSAEKTSVKGAKFDFEVVESGAKFVTYLESELEDNKAFEAVLASLKYIYMGTKNTRGYGKIEIKSIKCLSFNLSDNTEALNWLDFDLFDKDAFAAAASLNIAEECADAEITLKLKVNGSPLIRRYTTEIVGKDDLSPDYMQLTEGGEPVIPGTSWAGAFRSHMNRLCDEANLDAMKKSIENTFGFVSESAAQKSKITFAESKIEGASSKIIVRNSIDRFSGGSSNGALFTEKIWYGGETTLKITVNTAVEKAVFNLLAAAILDLHSGILSIGGETSIGHGLFEVVSVNGKENLENMSIADLVKFMEVKAI